MERMDFACVVEDSPTLKLADLRTNHRSRVERELLTVDVKAVLVFGEYRREGCRTLRHLSNVDDMESRCRWRRLERIGLRCRRGRRRDEIGQDHSGAGIAVRP